MGGGFPGNVRWRVWLHGLPAALWGGMLLALAVTPSLGAIGDVDIIEQQDKFSHFLEYFVLAFLTAFALVRATSRSPEWQLAMAFLFPAVYGILLEILQLLVPERDMSALDMTANVLGALVGAVVAMHLLDPGALRKG